MTPRRTIRMVVVAPGKWTHVMSKGKGHLIKIGPFEEWVPKRVVEMAEDGTLYVSSAYLTPGRLWTSMLKNYPYVKRSVDDVAYGEQGGHGGRTDDDDDDDLTMHISITKK